MLSPIKLFIIIGTIIFCIPSQIQIPFRVLGLIFFNLLVLKNKTISLNIFVISITIIIYVYFKILNHTFDTSLLMVAISIFPVYYFYNLKIKLTDDNLFILHVTSIIWIIGVIIQLCLFRYNGRPTLSYEINQSGSYLFLFYLVADVLKFRYEKLIIACLSLLLLSRLLIGCIIIFEIFRYCKPYLMIIIKRLTYSNIVISLAILISFFSIWYFYNMSSNIAEGSDGVGRLTTINDGSNYLRFKINSEIIFNLVENNDLKLLKDGYGDLGKNIEYKNTYFLMPHNEMFKAIAQFGVIFTIFCFFIAKKSFSKLVRPTSVIYFFPICIYTLILWVRFTIIPSIEMLFILYILLLANENRNCNI